MFTLGLYTECLKHIKTFWVFLFFFQLQTLKIIFFFEKIKVIFMTNTLLLPLRITTISPLGKDSVFHCLHGFLHKVPPKT